MSKADEMFKELGTNKIDNCDFCVYEGKINSNNRILFDKVEKRRIEELQAINEKVKELGWLDE